MSGLIYTLEMRRTLCRLLAERGKSNQVTRALVRLHVLVQRTGAARYHVDCITQN